MGTEIHQTLHGYSDGHRLLASSLTVPSGVRRTMLVMSDLSGHGMGASFETYLTGYPIPELDAYAFARTWYAHEMSRPGSVWTHTLLVPFRELGQLPRLAWMQHLFRRPEGRAWGAYEKPIITESIPAPDPADLGLAGLGRFLWSSLWALYTEPEKPVLYLGDPVHEFESVFLAIWEQQWPRLRRAFTFCTGSLAVRTLGSTPLDLQVVHPGRSSSVRRTAKEATILDPRALREPQISLDDCEWLDMAAEDLEHRQHQSRLRRYLWKYGADVPGQRASFRPLLRLFARTRRPIPDLAMLEAASEIVAKGFPSPRSGGSLKNALFGPPEASSDLPLTHSTEPERLEVLLTTPHHDAFDMPVLAPAKRAQGVWAENVQTGINLLLTLLDRGNATGTRVAVELIKSARTADLLRAVHASPHAVRPILNAVPTLATVPELWRIPAMETLAAEALVDLLPPGNRVWKEVVAVMLQDGTGEPVPIVAHHLGARATAYVLDWIAAPEHSVHPAVPAAWESVLRDDSHAVQVWLAKHPDAPLHAVAQALSTLRPTQFDPELLSALNWPTILERATWDLRGSRDLLNVQAFALAVAFENRIAESDHLVALCFQPVHDALSAGSLSKHQWGWIREAAPASSGRWASGEDRPSWLRAYLITSFLQYNWDPQQFARAVQHSDTLHRMIPLLLVSPSAWKLLLAAGITPEPQERGKNKGK